MTGQEQNRPLPGKIPREIKYAEWNLSEDPQDQSGNVFDQKPDIHCFTVYYKKNCAALKLEVHFVQQ